MLNGPVSRDGFELISVSEPDLCSDDPSRKLVRQVFGAIAEYERAMIVMKLHAARQRTGQREGRCEGRKPFGHRAGEQNVIHHILVLAGQGMNYSEIADRLNAEGVPTRANGAWYAATVSRILNRTARA